MARPKDVHERIEDLLRLQCYQLHNLRADVVALHQLVYREEDGGSPPSPSLRKVQEAGEQLITDSRKVLTEILDHLSQQRRQETGADDDPLEQLLKKKGWKN